MWRGIFISSARKSVALKKIKISWHHCAAWIHEQVVNWHFDEIVTPSEINPFLEFSIFSKICFRICQPSNWTFCNRHGMTIAMNLAMQVPRWAGHDKEIRRPQRIVWRTMFEDLSSRLVARVQTCRVTRSCDEPVRAHQPCHGHATRNVAATDMPAPE